jgi:hypothetical protein
MVIRYIIAWFPMVFLAVFNGALRDYTYGKTMSELRAHQLSSVTLIVIFGAYVWILSSRWPLDSIHQAVAVGLIWLVFTMLFEVGMGRFLMHQSWSEMIQAYNIFAGNLWPLVLLAVATLPILSYWLRKPV